MYTIPAMPRWVGRAGWTALFAALGGLAAWLALGRGRLGRLGARPPRALRPGVACSLAGHTLPPGGAATTFDAARPVLEAWLAQSLTLVVGDERPQRTRAELGVRIDWGRLRALATQAQNPASALRRLRAPGSPPGGVLLPVPYWVDEQAAMAALLQMKQGYDQAPVDARFDFKTKAVSPDAPGRRLDAWATLGRLDSALERGATALEVLVETEAPRHTAAELAGAAGVATDHVMGWFETQYASDAKHEARAYNLQVAASKLDGFVVMPDDTFDFNQVVGPRDEAHGYKVAPVIAQGALVDGMGGGTCQVAGTLHAAALFAGLDVVERRPHTRPSFYIKMGLDAAVAYPAVTLRLHNPYAFPVVLHESVQGVVRGEVLGPALPARGDLPAAHRRDPALRRRRVARRVAAQGRARAQAARRAGLPDHPLARPTRRSLLRPRAPDRLLPADAADLAGGQGAGGPEVRGARRRPPGVRGRRVPDDARGHARSWRRAYPASPAPTAGPCARGSPSRPRGRGRSARPRGRRTPGNGRGRERRRSPRNRLIRRIPLGFRVTLNAASEALARLSGRTVALCVTGSVAAYKAAVLARLLVKAGARVLPVMTTSATRFVGPVTLAGITGEAVATDMWDASVPGELHVKIAERADLVAIVPATADFLARLATGRADDLVAAVALCTRAPVLAAPAMHPRMWHHPATRRNVATLAGDRRVTLVGPVHGEVASGDQGMGRMAEPEDIAAALAALVAPAADADDLADVRVIVTAGPTVEDIDPGALPRQPVQRQDGLRHRGARGRPGGARDAHRGPRGARDARRACTASTCEARCRCARRSPMRRDRTSRRPTLWSWPPRWPITGPR